ncbi:signaling protein [Bordetella ansorpii]|uniref:diguanylate cyclase n=1 Tax=Bordetella ansorpii TaxID=288768 RepID=A0A157RRP8_9BORD|nr:sensor domain-containing diguanylate cyclase [Bordetella ansorpii]SAI60680.1 signaling protein [Bordetella ansorpii]
MHGLNEYAMRDALREQARLDALTDLQVLDGGPDPVFERITRLARATLRFPIAYVSMVGLHHEILKTRTPLPVSTGSRDTAFASYALQSAEPMVVPDTLEDPRFARFPQVAGSPYVRACWSMPLATRAGLLVGALTLLDYAPREANAEDSAILKDFGRLAAESMELRAQASTDVLTGVQSRRAFLGEGERIFNSRHPDRHALSCVILDLDDFRRLNDTLGYEAGDDALRRIGELLRGGVRPDTPIGRVGGEEFAILLPGETLYGAHTVSERLRHALSQLSDQGFPGLSASCGLAERGSADRGFTDLLDRASQQAYVARHAGRNCTRPDLAHISGQAPGFRHRTPI